MNEEDRKMLASIESSVEELRDGLCRNAVAGVEPHSIVGTARWLIDKLKETNERAQKMHRRAQENEGAVAQLAARKAGHAEEVAILVRAIERRARRWSHIVTKLSEMLQPYHQERPNSMRRMKLEWMIEDLITRVTTAEAAEEQLRAEVIAQQSSHLDSLRKVRDELAKVEQRIVAFHEELNELLPRPFGMTIFGAIQALKKDAALGKRTRELVTAVDEALEPLAAEEALLMGITEHIVAETP